MGFSFQFLTLYYIPIEEDQHYPCSQPEKLELKILVQIKIITKTTKQIYIYLNRDKVFKVLVIITAIFLYVAFGLSHLEIESTLFGVFWELLILPAFFFNFHYQ